MSILDFARSDWNKITTSKNDFGVEMTLTAPTGETATVVGLHTKHWFKVDFESNEVLNTRNAHVSISEQALIALYYPVRNDKGEVRMKGDIVAVKDSTGIEKLYKLDQVWPDETVGQIVCQLGDYIPKR